MSAKRKRKNCPEPAKDLSKVFYGWLMPNGKLYACEYGDHEKLAYLLGYNSGAELEDRSKGLKLFNKYMREDNSWFISEWARLKWESISQAQRDIIFDYAVAHDIELFEVAPTLDLPAS